MCVGGTREAGVFIYRGHERERERGRDRPTDRQVGKHRQTEGQIDRWLDRLRRVESDGEKC